MAVSVDASSAARTPPAATAAERAVADQLPIGASPDAARAARGQQAALPPDARLPPPSEQPSSRRESKIWLWQSCS